MLFVYAWLVIMLGGIIAIALAAPGAVLILFERFAWMLVVGVIIALMARREA